MVSISASSLERAEPLQIPDMCTELLEMEQRLAEAPTAAQLH
jgi:hypothetical protein